MPSKLHENHPVDMRAPMWRGVFFGDKSQFAWSAEERWDEARALAKAKLHELFPFLPEDEKPISYARFVATNDR